MSRIKTSGLIMLGIYMILLLSGCTLGMNLKQNDAMLVTGVMNENYEQINEALEAGANINKIEGTGLHESNPVQIAYKEQQFKLIKHLINIGADPNYKMAGNVTILMEMSELGDKDICSFLLEKGAKIQDVDWEGNTALEYAVKGNNGLKFINLLIDKLRQLMQ